MIRKFVLGLSGVGLICSGQSSFAEVKVAGFADVTYQAMSTRSKDAQSNGVTTKENDFGLGDLDLFLSSSLGDDFSWLSETAISAGDNNQTGVDVERLLVKYSPSDFFNISIGRFHSALGYWNDTYHHGKWLQLSVSRPWIYTFEDGGGILPIHAVGIEVRGNIAHKLGYILNVGKGPRINKCNNLHLLRLLCSE